MARSATGISGALPVRCSPLCSGLLLLKHLKRKPHGELRPEAVALAKRLHRASPKTGKRMSLRKIAAALTQAGHLNERGQPFNPKSVRSMLDQKC